MTEDEMAIQAGNILRGEACGCCAHRLPIVIWEAGQPAMHRRAIRCGRVEGGAEVDPNDGCSLFESYRHEHLGQGVEP